MPELPEVETTLRGIRPTILGQTIKKITVRQQQLRWPISKPLLSFKEDTVLEVSRRAKYLLIQLSLGTILIHLGMSGRLRILSAMTPPKKHDHLDIEFENNKILRYTDPRRFGCILYLEDEVNQHRLLVNLGPEPLSKDFNSRYLFEIAQNRKQKIKSLIMDQAVVVGVGNIYAAEALFAAKISPLRAAKSLSLIECARLVAAIKKILKEAIKQGGTTLKDFSSPDGKPGYFLQKLFVYGRGKQACYLCKTTLKSSKIAQRTTVYCSTCQQ